MEEVIIFNGEEFHGAEKGYKIVDNLDHPLMIYKKFEAKKFRDEELKKYLSLPLDIFSNYMNNYTKNAVIQKLVKYAIKSGAGREKLASKYQREKKETLCRWLIEFSYNSVGSYGHSKTA